MPQVQLNTRIDIDTYNQLKEVSEKLNKSIASIVDKSLNNYFKEVSPMKNAIEGFFATETYTVDRGYTIHVSRDPRYATEAVVEDADGQKTLVDVSEIPYEDFESFLDAIVEKYESK